MSDEITSAAEAARRLLQGDPSFDLSTVFTPEPVRIDAQGLLLAYTADAKPTALDAWLRRCLPDVETMRLTATPVDQLAKAVREAMGAGKLAVTFGCGHLWNAQELDALSFLVLPRPRDTYAFVLTGAENLREAAELELAERGLRRLLPTAFGSGKDVPEGVDVFLWSDKGGGGPFQERAVKDMASFQRWLVTDLTPSCEMLRATGDRLREQLAPEARRTAPTDKLADDETQRLRRAREALSSMRPRLSSIWNDASTQLQRELEADMARLEQGLKDRFAGIISRHRSLTRAAQAEWEAEQKARFQRCGEELSASWREQVQHALSAVKEVVDLVDWTPVNESLSPVAGEWQPEAFLQGLNHSIDYFTRIPRQGGLSCRAEFSQMEIARPSPAGLLSGAALGTALCVVAPRMPILLRMLVISTFAAAGHTLEPEYFTMRAKK